MARARLRGHHSTARRVSQVGLGTRRVVDAHGRLGEREEILNAAHLVVWPFAGGEGGTSGVNQPRVEVWVAKSRESRAANGHAQGAATQEPMSAG